MFAEQNFIKNLKYNDKLGKVFPVAVKYKVLFFLICKECLWIYNKMFNNTMEVSITFDQKVNKKKKRKMTQRYGVTQI